MKTVFTQIKLLMLAALAFIGDFVHAHIFAHMARSGLIAGITPMEVSPGMFERYRVTNPDTSALVWQPLYDFQVYPAAGLQQFTFFQQPQGSGKTSTPGATAASPKTLSDTNMTAAGSLPSGMEYLVQAIEVYFFPGSVNTADTYTPAKVTTDATAALLAAGISANNDVQQVYNEGLFKFNVLNQIQYTDTPLRKFAPSNWMETDAALATTNATLSLAIGQTRPKGDPLVLNPPLSLQPAVNFSVTIDYPALRALPSGFNGRIGVVFNGYLKRATQ